MIQFLLPIQIAQKLQMENEQMPLKKDVHLKDTIQQFIMY